MEFATLVLAVFCAAVTAQTTTDPPMDLMDTWAPFQNPGEILSNGALTVPYILEIFGGFWSQYRLIDSYAYACTDVLPELTMKIPEVGNFSDTWGPLCDEVLSARNDPDGFNATGFCYNLVAIIAEMFPDSPPMTSPAPPGDVSPIPGTDIPSGESMNIQMPGGMMDPPINLSDFQFILDVFGNATMDYFEIDINGPLTICPQAHRFLEPSLPRLLYDFGTEVLTSLVTETTPDCATWDDFLAGFGIDASSVLYPIVQEAEELVSKMLGFDSKEELCGNITDALITETTGALVMGVMNHLFHTVTDEDTCANVANDVIEIINDVIMVMTPDDNSTAPFSITNDTIYQYTGFMDVGDLCEAVDKTFSGCHTKGFDRDACSVCVLSQQDGAPSFLSSTQRDCYMRCPLDVDHGAVINQCGYCVLGASGLPATEGENVCGDCGEETTCIGCDEEPHSGKVLDNCQICDGNHTDCMIVVLIEPSAIPENMDYEIALYGAGFHSDPTPVCVFTRLSDSMKYNVTMNVTSPSMGYCAVNLESATYQVNVWYDTTPVTHFDNLEVYTPVTIDSVVQDEFTLISTGQTVQYTLRFRAVDGSDFIQANVLGLLPYLMFLNGEEEMAPLLGFIETEATLAFALQAPPESTQLIVVPSFNKVDLLPTTSGEPFMITFYDPAPQLGTAILSFKPTGNILVLEFPMEIHIMEGVLPDCDAIFMTMVPDRDGERNLLGEGSRCLLSRNHRMLEIELWQGENLISPGETITIRRDVIYGSGDYPSAAGETLLTVAPGVSPPVNVVLRGSTTVSSCGNVRLSARETMGSASRGFSYMWMVSPADDANLNEAVQAVTESELTINGSLLAENVMYTFTVFATNFLGGTGVGTIEVSRTPSMVPDLTIVPSPVDPRRVMLSESFYLEAQVTFYSDCEGAEPRETMYVWSVDNDGVMLDETTKMSKTLYVPAFSVPGGIKVTFTVEISGMNSSENNVTIFTFDTSQTISTLSSDPVAVIVGGHERHIGIDSGIVQLDGSGSHDPDQPGKGDLEYLWRCVQVPENILCVSAVDGSFFPHPDQLESPTVTFNASHMAPMKTYQLTLRVSAGRRESPETSVNINAMSGETPQVLVSASASSPVLATKPLALTANIQHTRQVNITWSAVGENDALDEANLTISASNTVLEGSTWSVVHLQPGVLRPGETYTVEVSATDDRSQSGSSSMELMVAGSVSSCVISLQNGHNYTELEQITLAVDNCVTDEQAYPLTYQLLAGDSAGNERSLTPAGVESWISITGPPAMIENENITFVARVCNAHGSCSSFSTTVSIEMRESFDLEALKTDIVSQESFKGNFLKAFINLNALSYVEDRMAPDGRRRRSATTTMTTDRAGEQLELLYSAATTAVLEPSAASTLIDASESISIDDLSHEDTEMFLEILRTLVDVFGCDQSIPSYSASVVLGIIRRVEERKNMNEEHDDMEMMDMMEEHGMPRELTTSLTKASVADLLLGDTPIETSSNALTSCVFYAIPQGIFPTREGREGAFHVDLGREIAEMYGGFWSCGNGLCTGVHIQFDQYSLDYDPYSTEKKDRENRASAILAIKLFDPSSYRTYVTTETTPMGEELMVESLNDPILVNMSVSGEKRNHDLKCHVWDKEDEEWSGDDVETEKLGVNLVQCKLPRTGACVVLAEGRGGSSAVIIIVSIIAVLLVLTLIIAIVIVIKKRSQKDKGEGNVATNDKTSAVATAMTSDAKQNDGSQEASTEYAYDFNMQNMASKVNC